MVRINIKTEDVEKWWEENPFTLGVAKNDYKNEDLVGRIDFDKMDSHYFNEIERKFRKHSHGGSQDEGEPLLSRLVDYSWLRGKKILDIAVGSGFSTVAFAEGGGLVTGIDLTDFAVKQTKRNLEVRGLSADILKMDAQDLQFEENFFDFVNAWGCFMHMPNTEKAITEACRVTKEGGRLLAYMYNKNSWPYWFNLILLRGIILGGLIRYKGNTVRLSSRYADGSAKGGNMLTKFYTPAEVEKMFRNAGYTTVKVFPWDLPDEPNGWPMRIFPVFKYLPKKVKALMSKRWGYGLIIQAEK